MALNGSTSKKQKLAIAQIFEKGLLRVDRTDSPWNPGTRSGVSL
jgi:hypothetical protein